MTRWVEGLQERERSTATIALGTKAQTLQALAGQLRQARILPQVCFTVQEWRSDPAGILDRVQGNGWLSRGTLIVRSSALAEDRNGESLAGRFRSISGVRDEIELVQAVQDVIASYAGAGPEDEVFVQPMLEGVTCSGVAFSRDPNTGAPYLVINYDEATGQTDRVTSGQSNDLKTLYLYKKYTEGARFSPELLQVAELMRELETVLGIDSLDVEFAWAEGALYLLQVRPLVQERAFHGDLQPTLQRIAAKVQAWNRPHPHLHGRRTVFGVMPDWNPAEIIGIRPRPLALSLYKEIVTDRIWAEQRFAYGYKNVSGSPLLYDFGGLPYIDVRASFNSFVPAGVSEHLSEKLVNYYLDQLIESPSKHDKVEFEIVFTCYSFDLQERMEPLLEHGFAPHELQELQERLRELTNRITRHDGLWKQDIAKIELLKQRYETITRSTREPIEKIYWLLEDCKRDGTLPFAGLARAGFIAMQLLQSLVQVGVMSRSDYDRFMNSLDTVSSQMARDFYTLEKAAFLQRYGHLRPGTYDVLSPRYDEESESYFDWSQRCEVSGEKELGGEARGEFAWTPEQEDEINRLLVQHGIEHDAASLLAFFKGAIEGREYAKFVFSKSLSDAIVVLKHFAELHGFSAEEVSYLDIACVRKLYGTSGNVEETLARSIESGKEQHKLTERLVLPPLITDALDVWGFELPPFEPNFVTQKTARGCVAKVEEKEQLERRIVFIESADPGYDWIFTKGIAGFVTLYGGANSHMAIRASELGIPAVIGAGEANFRRWASSDVLEVDCMNRQVRVLR